MGDKTRFKTRLQNEVIYRIESVSLVVSYPKINDEAGGTDKTHFEAMYDILSIYTNG